MDVDTFHWLVVIELAIIILLLLVPRIYTRP